MKSLAEKKYWKNYWKNKNDVVKVIGMRNFFDLLFVREIKKSTNREKSLLEIGGFPGTYAIYFKKFFNLKTTLVDYFIEINILKKLLKKNNLKQNSINIIESNIFTFKSKEGFDYVISFGFLEHFKNDDLGKVISKHVELAKDGGKIIIAIPNFLGINGWIQRVFDQKNYAVHNIDSMETNRLDEIMKAQSVESYKIEYYGGFLIWLEEIEKRSKSVQLIFLFLNLFGHLLKYFGFNSKITSPYIVIVAKK